MHLNLFLPYSIVALYTSVLFVVHSLVLEDQQCSIAVFTIFTRNGPVKTHLLMDHREVVAEIVVL